MSSARLSPRRTRVRPRAGHRFLLFALPAALAFLLAAPAFRFTFLFDDFDFLIRAQSFHLTQLLPNTGSMFYRPLSREVYFGLLYAVGGGRPLMGHLWNAAFLALSVALMVGMGVRLAGARVGFLSGLLFAALGTWPLLIGWVSGCQDLMAASFFLGALHLALSRRPMAAFVCAGAAILSKETSIFLMPVLAVLPWIRGDRTSLRWSIPMYGGLVLAWCAIHPLTRSFLVRGPNTGRGGYVGWDNLGAAQNAAGMARALLNLPPANAVTSWSPERAGLLLAALAILALAYRRIRTVEFDARLGHPRHVLLLGILITVLAGVPTVLFVKHWSPYYAGIPAIGMSILAAYGLARVAPSLALGVVALYLTLGVWSRGADDGGTCRPLEQSWSRLSSDLDHVRSGMWRLHVGFPDSTRMFVSVHLPLTRAIHSHLLRYQAPRIWYREPALEVLPAGRFDSRLRPAVVLWVDPACDVFEIELPSLRARSSGPKPDHSDYQRARRLLALGLARAGNVDEAIHVLAGMDESDEATWAFDRRLAAVLCLTQGRISEAGGLLRGVPAMNRAEALCALTGVLRATGATGESGEAAFGAFGLARTDVEAWRFLMNFFMGQQEYEPALRMASQLLRISPNDRGARAVVEWIRGFPKWDAVTIAPTDACP
jgi:hypothetical protein